MSTVGFDSAGQVGLFGEPGPQPGEGNALLQFIARDDLRGAVRFIMSAPQETVFSSVLSAGYSIIGFHHGRQAVLEHIFNQIVADSNTLSAMHA